MTITSPTLDLRLRLPWYRWNGRLVTPIDGEAMRLGPAQSHGIQYVKDDLGRIDRLPLADFQAKRVREPKDTLAVALRPLTPAIITSRFPEAAPKAPPAKKATAAPAQRPVRKRSRQRRRATPHPA